MSETATEVAAAEPKSNGAEIMEQVIIKGDLSKLTPAERSNYYMIVCKSVGLNPLTKPFEYINLNGKLTLYALRTCTDQLRTIHGVSVEAMTESERDGVFMVTAKVKNRDGRTDIAKGAVAIANLKGDALCNAMMKAETKAKRRATLSICGLGFLDESEIETIPDKGKAQPRDVTPTRGAPKVIEAQPPADPETGELLQPSPIPVPELPDRGGADWVSWTLKLAAALNAAQSSQEIDAWMDANETPLKNLRHEAEKDERFARWHDRLLTLADDRRKALSLTDTALSGEVVQGEPEPDILAAG